MSTEELLERLLRELPERIAEAVDRKSRKRERALLSIRQAAIRLGVDREWLGTMVNKGALRTVPVGSHKRIPAAELERLQKEGVKPPPKGKRSRQPSTPPDDPGAEIRALKLD